QVRERESEKRHTRRDEWHHAVSPELSSLAFTDRAIKAAEEVHGRFHVSRNRDRDRRSCEDIDRGTAPAPSLAQDAHGDRQGYEMGCAARRRTALPTLYSRS